MRQGGTKVHPQSILVLLWSEPPSHPTHPCNIRSRVSGRQNAGAKWIAHILKCTHVRWTSPKDAAMLLHLCYIYCAAVASTLFSFLPWPKLELRKKLRKKSSLLNCPKPEKSMVKGRRSRP